jgi:hypothetical protein
MHSGPGAYRLKLHENLPDVLAVERRRVPSPQCHGKAHPPRSGSNTQSHTTVEGRPCLT